MKNTGKTILFVEDNPLVITIYRNWLQREGFQVNASGDGLDAIEKLPQMKPSLVILDLMLPMLDGLDVLKFIREHDELKNTPVLILSNAYMDDQAGKALKAGANKLLLKTQCTPARLIEAARELLGTSEKSAAHPTVQSKLAAANEALLKETREDFLSDAPAEVTKIREHCLAFVKTAGTPASAEQLNNLYQRVRFLCARAGLGDCTKIAHLASALEATLFEIIFKKTSPSASALQTIAQAVDCLGRLFQSRQIESLEMTLKAKVLVVDDDPVCNFVTVAAMKRAKLEAVSVDAPAVALEMAQKENYDIVLLDINMPGMTGFEVCEKLRNLPNYQKTPVIFVTSNSEFQNRAQAVLSGGNDLIAKPISPLELALKTIMHLIEPRERAEKSAADSKNRTATSEVIEVRTENSADAVRNIKIKMDPAVKPVASGNGHANLTAHRNGTIKMPPLPAEIKIPSPALFTADTEQLPLNRVHSPKNGTNHKTLMKNENHNQPAMDKLVTEVSRIIFGDDTSSEMHLRLTRIALEHYDVPQIMTRPNGESFNGIVPEVGRIIFGEEKLSEMHLRLTRIALERYGVHQMTSLPVETHGTNGANGSTVANGNGHAALRMTAPAMAGAH